MSLQQRYQRLGRNDSWLGALRDTILLVIGLPVALAVAGMFVTSKEPPPHQAQAQAARQARRTTLTATRRPRELRADSEYRTQAARAANEIPAAQLTTEPEPETSADQRTTTTKITRRTVW